MEKFALFYSLLCDCKILIMTGLVFIRRRLANLVCERILNDFGLITSEVFLFHEKNDKKEERSKI